VRTQLRNRSTLKGTTHNNRSNQRLGDGVQLGYRCKVQTQLLLTWHMYGALVLKLTMTSITVVRVTKRIRE
jgi:hypothetical protein